MVAPVLIAAAAGVVSVIASVGVNEAAKASADSANTALKEKKNTLNSLIKGVNALIQKGELGSAVVAFREAITYANDAGLKAHVPRLESDLRKLKASIERKVDQLEPEFNKERKHLMALGDWGGVHRVYQEFLDELRGLLPPDSPALKAYEGRYQRLSGPRLTGN